MARGERGGADAFELSEAELALACGSQSGGPRHVDAVTAWLTRIGLSVADLECGPQLPSYAPALLALLSGGGMATAAHNNCSGKHSGFLTLARHLGVPTKGRSEEHTSELQALMRNSYAVFRLKKNNIHQK